MQLSSFWGKLTLASWLQGGYLYQKELPGEHLFPHKYIAAARASSLASEALGVHSTHFPLCLFY